MLVLRGVRMERYGLPGMKTDAKGLFRNDAGDMGPRAIAWFKDLLLDFLECRLRILADLLLTSSGSEKGEGSQAKP